MTDPARPQILRPDALAAIERRLAAAVATDPTLEPARQALLRPVRLLDACATLAVPALGDDPTAVERLRLLLSAATTFEIDAAAARDALKATPTSATAADLKAPVELPYQAGLVDLGAAVIVGLACIRAGARLHLQRELLGTFTGLLLAVGPAETVLRWERLRGGDEGFAALLGSLTAPSNDSRGHFRVLAGLLAVDPEERARWTCVLRVAGADGLGRDALRSAGWDGASIEGIAGLSAEGDRWTLTGSMPARGEGSQRLRVVVAGRRGIVPATIEAEVAEWTAERVSFTVAGGLAGGWVGFTSVLMAVAANALRGELRKRWSVHHPPCLPEGAPTDLIPLLPDLPAPPPLWVLEPAHLVAAMLTADGGEVDGAIDPGRTLTVEVTAAPAEAPAWVRLADIPESEQPLTAGEAQLAVPPSAVTDGTVLTVELADRPGGEAIDRRALPPLRIARGLRVVLALPAVIAESGAAERIEHAEAQRLLAMDGLSAGVGIACQVLPTLDDDLAAIYGPVTGADDGRVDRLLATLAAAAAVTNGAEDALWLALLPGTRAWSRAAPADAALRVAAATASGLAALLAQMSGVTAPSPRTVLRLVGTMDAFGGVAWRSTRAEERALGSGGGVDFGIAAVALDDEGRVLATQPLRAVSDKTRGSIACLVPLMPETTAVELRDARGTVLASVRRPLGRPSLGEVAVEDGELAWSYEHERGLPARLVLEAALPTAPTLAGFAAPTTPASWVPLERWDSCCRPGAEVAWQRYALPSGAFLRLVAEDGWYQAVAPVSGDPPQLAGSLRIRRMPDGRLWADGAGQPSWHLPGSKPPSRARLLAAPAEGGTVTLSMRIGRELIHDSLIETVDGSDNG
jgi:hypothetical protein